MTFSTAMRIRAVLAVSLLSSLGCSLALPSANKPLPREAVIQSGYRPSLNLSGVVTAPASLLSNNGGGIIANNGGGLVANNAAGYRTRAAEAWTPVANAEVVVEDVFGRPVRGLPAVTTDASGRFSLRGVPSGQAYVVKALIAGVQLTALVKPLSGRSDAALDPATTAVTEHLRQEFATRQGALAQVPVERFETLSRTVRDALVTGSIALDLTSPEAAAEVFKAAQAKSAGLGDAAKQAVEETEKAIEDAIEKGDLKPENLSSPPPEIVVSPPPLPLPSVGGIPRPSPIPSIAGAPGGGSPTPTAGPSAEPVVRTFTVGKAPESLAVDESGDVWVTNKDSNSVTRLRGTDGSVIGTYTVPADPWGIAVGGNVVWVACNGAKRLLMLKVADGSEIRSEDTWSKLPREVAIDSQGNAWVTTEGDGRTTLFTPKGAFRESNVTGGQLPGSNNNKPQGIAIRGTTAWVANTGRNDVVKFTGGPGTRKNFPLSGAPTGVAIDAGGNVWVTRNGIDKVAKLSSAGAVLANYSTGEKPYGVAAVRGSIWITNAGADTVTHLDGTTGSARNIYTVGRAPHGIAVDAAGNVWVANSGGNTVSRIAPVTTD